MLNDIRPLMTSMERRRQQRRRAILRITGVAMAVAILISALIWFFTRPAAVEGPVSIAPPLPAPEVTQPEPGETPGTITLPLTLPNQTGTESPTPAAPASAPPADEPEEKSGKWLEEKVKNGDSLSLIFDRLGLSPTLLYNITHSGEEAKALINIQPGETLRVRLDETDAFQELVYRRSPVSTLTITRDTEGFHPRILTKELEKRVGHLSGTITNSLYLDAQQAGLSDSLIMEMANIFGWDIDFALEIRKGDRFSVIFEELYLDGERYRSGPILAAEFVNRGKVFRAIRYEDDNKEGDYYGPDGKSMRKAFLRAPVDFRRISSHFAKSRYHPVLGKKRPHRGVDYAAAIGTPVRASGNGKVIHKGWKGGYGNTIIIQHANRYTTLYGHLNSYRKEIKKGSRVKQGQTIGYVGKTGLATGPHLHYEFRVDGAHRNPLTVKLPEATPIAKKYREDFQQKSAPLLAQLDLFSRALAQNSSGRSAP